MAMFVTSEDRSTIFFNKNYYIAHNDGLPKSITSRLEEPSVFRNNAKRSKACTAMMLKADRQLSWHLGGHQLKPGIASAKTKGSSCNKTTIHTSAKAIASTKTNELLMCVFAECGQEVMESIAVQCECGGGHYMQKNVVLMLVVKMENIICVIARMQ